MLIRRGRIGGFFAANAWLLASFGGLVNATGRVGTGPLLRPHRPAERLPGQRRGLGRVPVRCAVGHRASRTCCCCSLVVGVSYWQYGGTLALMPAFTADYFGPKNLGLNYGLVFIGWGIAFFVPQIADYLSTTPGALDPVAFHISAGLLIAAIVLSRMVSKPEPTLPGR